MQFEKYAEKCKWRIKGIKNKVEICLPNSNGIDIDLPIYPKLSLCREENCGLFSMLVCMVEDIREPVNDLQKQLQENGTLKKFIVAGEEMKNEDN